MKYNKNIIHKPKIRNYITGFRDFKNSLNYLNENVVHQNSFENNSLNNNYFFQSLNSLNIQNTFKGKMKEILKNHRNNIYNHKNNLEAYNKNNNIHEKKIEGKIEGYSINLGKNLNCKICSNPYKKRSPYKKPESICGNTYILKEIKNSIGKIDNFKTIQAQSRVSNMKTN